MLAKRFSQRAFSCWGEISSQELELPGLSSSILKCPFKKTKSLNAAVRRLLQKKRSYFLARLRNIHLGQRRLKISRFARKIRTQKLPKIRIGRIEQLGVKLGAF
jgi:hypothetical protein